MITLDTLKHWLAIPKENEHIEFKEAKQQFDKNKLLEHCVVLANEGGGHLVLGVSDKPPRKVVGTKSFPNVDEIKSYILSILHFRVDVHELQHSNGRVLAFVIPSRPNGHPLSLKGTYLMRSGEELVPMTADQLRRIFSEGEPDWLTQAAKIDASGDDVIELLDTQTYFDLINRMIQKQIQRDMHGICHFGLRVF